MVVVYLLVHFVSAIICLVYSSRWNYLSHDCDSGILRTWSTRQPEDGCGIDEKGMDVPENMVLLECWCISVILRIVLCFICNHASVL